MGSRTDIIINILIILVSFNEFHEITGRYIQFISPYVIFPKLRRRISIKFDIGILNQISRLINFFIIID
jgi:hypothetical protein